MKKNESMTYGDILNMWLNSKRDLKLQSSLNYESLIGKYIAKELGTLKIEELKSTNVESLFDSLKEKNVAISTKKTLIYIVRSSLNYAHKEGYTEYIDVSMIKFKRPIKTIFVLSREEQNTLENKLKDKVNIRKVCLLLCLYSGLRVGEVCGLKWEDIDFSNKSLIIKRTIERIRNKDENINSKTVLIESTPKSETSNRIIPVPEFILHFLKEYRSNDNFYLLSKSESLYDPRLFESFYSRILKSCNISSNKFHTLRHTFATRSIESKMDIKTLSEILGHSQVETTLKLYVHPSYEMKRSSIENLVRFMENP